MSVAIRLQRHGGKKKPFYKIVATDKRNNRDGSFIERLGHYDPRRNPIELQVKQERLDYWLSNGANLSHTLKCLLKNISQKAAL